jgi:hypothetical protein
MTDQQLANFDAEAKLGLASIKAKVEARTGG